MGTGTTTYSYDGDGRRVKKVTGSPAVTTIYVYDAMGKLVAEYNDSQQQPTGGTKYLTADHLGSTRVVTGQNQAVVARYDYLPYGEEIGSGIGGRTMAMGYSVGDTTRQKFTSKERDIESGLDYFLARYYSSAQGRFTSPDPIPITPERQLDPQALNLYQYVRNNPLAYLDPTGMELVRLGQHTDEQINKRIGEIDAELKKEGLTDKQRQALQGEHNTLLIEQEGNRVVNELLKRLDASGERQGLQLSDFTLSTDPKSDFKSLLEKRGYKGAALQKELNSYSQDVAVVFRGQSKEIFIVKTQPYYEAVAQGAGLIYPNYGEIVARDVLTIASTYLPHEKFHRDRSASERLAYQEQLRVLNKFGPGAFVNQNVFRDFQKILTGAAGTGKPSPLKK